MPSGMRIGLLDPNKFIHNRDLRYVEDIHIFEGGSENPSPKGLISPEIFGESFEERRKRLGAIKLDGFYLHPLIYSRVFKRHYREIDDLLSGQKYYTICEDGDLKEADDENEGGTGLEFLYDNFDKINISNLRIKDDDSIILKQLKASIHKLDKHQLFIDKWLVIPLMFRDINEADGQHVSLDILNEKYKKLISLVKIVESSKDNPLFDVHQVRFRIQLHLTDIFDYLMEKALRGKDSVIKKQVMSKKIDYTSRLVMSAPSYDNDKIGDSPIDLDTCGLPLSAVADMYAPYVINNMYQVLKAKYDRGEINCDLDEFEEIYNKQELHEIINIYVESWGERFDPLIVPGTEDEPIYIEGKVENTNYEYGDQGGLMNIQWDDFKRPMTITDLVYQGTHYAVEVNEKYNIFTRYPVNKIAA